MVDELIADRFEFEGNDWRKLYAENRDAIDDFARENGYSTASEEFQRRATRGYFDGNELPKVPWYEKLYAAFKAWIRKTFAGRLAKLSDVDMRKLFRDALAGLKKNRAGETSQNFSLKNAVASKEGYRVEKVNPRAGTELNRTKGVVQEKTNLVFSPEDAPKERFGNFITNKILEYESKHPIAGKYYTDALQREVEIRKSTARNIANHGGPDAKYNLYPAIPEILRNSVLLQTEVFDQQGNRASKSHLIASKVRYGNERYVAISVIHETDNVVEYDYSLLVLEDGILGKNRAEIENGTSATADASSHSARVLKVARNALLSSGFDVKDPKNINFSLDDGSLENSGDKNLVVVHNVSPQKLRDAAKLGGMPAPSLAVIDAEKSDFNDYGDITLIDDKDLIDPKWSMS